MRNKSKNHRQPPNFKYTETEKPLPGYFAHFLPVLDIPKLPRVLFPSRDGRHPWDTILILTFKHSSTVLGQSQLAHQCFFAGFHGSTKCERSYWLCCKLVFAPGCRQSGCRDPFKSARSVIGMMSPGAPRFPDCWENSNGFDWTVAECECCPGRTSEGRRRCKELLMARTKRKYAETKQWMGQGGSALLHALFDNVSLSGCI